MQDLTQFILTFVIFVTASMLAVIGVQVFLILREFRKTLKKGGLVLENMEKFLSNKKTDKITPLKEAHRFFKVIKKKI